MSLHERQNDPADVASGLREQALTVSPDALGVRRGPGHENVWGVVMETAYPEAVVTLVALADGTTSLYFSSGGGTIGAGTHAAVRTASEEFIKLANVFVAELAPADSHPLPTSGRARFYARTFTGIRTAEADEQDLGYGRHTLSPLFHAGHAVIAAIRECTGGP